jgi:DNA-binding GntR family transcriptional regulator
MSSSDAIHSLCKSRRQSIELIQMWAALESMSARLSTVHASDVEIGSLRVLLHDALDGRDLAHYSATNIAFHDGIIALGGSRTILEATRSLLHYVRTIRLAAVSGARAQEYLFEDLEILGALEERRTELAENLTRRQALGLVRDLEAGLHELPRAALPS